MPQPRCSGTSLGAFCRHGERKLWRKRLYQCSRGRYSLNSQAERRLHGDIRLWSCSRRTCSRSKCLSTTKVTLIISGKALAHIDSDSPIDVVRKPRTEIDKWWKLWQIYLAPQPHWLSVERCWTETASSWRVGAKQKVAFQANLFSTIFPRRRQMVQIYYFFFHRLDLSFNVTTLNAVAALSLRFIYMSFILFLIQPRKNGFTLRSRVGLWLRRKACDSFSYLLNGEIRLCWAATGI